jgi:chromosome segregation protein
MVDLLAQEKLQVDGRVGLIQLNDPTTLGADPEVNLNGASGVIGRADRLVQVQPLYADFIKRMLGGTWIVKTLSDAVALQKGQGRGARFVTLDGEIVEADGTVVVGPKAVSSGIVSRRSELRALTRELERLENEIGDCR